MAVVTAVRRRRGRWVEDPEVGLMLRVQAGDAAAFAELARRYRPLIFGRFCRWLGGREEAEDLTQDVFLRLYRYRDRYRPRAKFATWVFHIARNVARNALRTRRRRPCLRFDALESDGARLPAEWLLPDRGEEPSRPLERAELAGRVRSAVSGLAERQRTAVELHQFQDRTYTQVAAEMAMTPKAAKSLLYRARNQLRASLGDFVEAQDRT
jgi:RNA polymerase sigma-70 factor, ECF subfamily